MPRINLLPWRDEERKERKLKFLVALGGAAVARGLSWPVAGYLLMDSMIERAGSAQRAARRARSPCSTSRSRRSTASRPTSSASSRAWRSSRSCSVRVRRSCTSSTRSPSSCPMASISRASRRPARASSSKASRSRRRACPPSCATSTAPSYLKNPELEVVETKKRQGTAGATFMLFADQAGGAEPEPKLRQETQEAHRVGRLIHEHSRRSEITRPERPGTLAACRCASAPSSLCFVRAGRRAALLPGLERPEAAARPGRDRAEERTAQRRSRPSTRRP